jgi:hypothetical protein
MNMSITENPDVSETEVVSEDSSDEASDEADPIEESVEKSPEEGASSYDNVRSLLPVHAAPKRGAGGGTLNVSRQRGRPRKVEKMPTTSDLEYHSRMSDAKHRFIDDDPVVVATSGKVEPTALLRKLRTEIAKEAAALHFQRIENEKYGKDTSQTSTRRIDALTKIAHIELEIAKLGPSQIDVRSEKFQLIMQLFVAFVQEAASETLSPEALNLFFNKLETKMSGWENKAEDVIR